MTVCFPWTNVRRCSVALALAAAAGLGCSGGSGSSPTPTPTPPSLADLSLYPTTLLAGQGGGSVLVAYHVAVLDAGADVVTLVVTVLDAAGLPVDARTYDIQNPPGMTVGVLEGQAAIPTTAVGTFTIRLQVIDSGGDGSNALEGDVAVADANAAPVILSLSPASVTTGAFSFTLTVKGTGFLPSSYVSWNAMQLPTAYVDAGTLEATVPQYDLYNEGTATIRVYSPPPGGGTSNAATFAITPPPPNPVPSLTAISPSSATVGSAGVTLTVTGSGFAPSSSVRWGPWGTLTTTFVDASTLRADVSSYNLSSIGAFEVSVQTPAPGGGTTGSLTFAVTRPVLPGVTIVDLFASDLAWDPYQRKLYVAVPSSSPLNPNTVTVLDPYTGQLGGSAFAGSEPRMLAISDDGRRLYAGLGGASFVNGFALPDLAQDLSIPLGRDPTYGAYVARDVQVAPGAAETVAVAAWATSGGSGWSVPHVTVYDGATPRATVAQPTTSRYGSLQWGADASVLYAANTDGYGGADLYTLAVDAAGVVETNDFRGAFSGYAAPRIHFDAATGLVYGDDGRALDPATGLVVGTYALHDAASYTYYYGPTMVPDPSLGTAFFAGYSGYSSSSVILKAFDLDHFVPTRSTTLSYVPGPATHLLRFGTDGLAFIANGAQVVLVRGEAVLPAATTSNPAPALTAVAPSSVTAGAGNLRLTVTGTGFVPASVVRWNGAERTTRFVSETELVAFVPGSDVAAAGTATVTVASPAPGGGTTDGATVGIVAP